MAILFRDMDISTGTLQEEEDRLKQRIIANLEAQFVDEFEKWLERMEFFNTAINEYNKTYDTTLALITYDEFCQLFRNGSQVILDKHIRMDSIVPDQKEMDMLKSTMDETTSADVFKEKYSLLLEAKYEKVKRDMAQVWDEDVFKWMISSFYGEEHYLPMLPIKAKVMRERK
jgi:hypothetical protein